MFDEVAAVGGMNHYLLADDKGSSGASLKYGIHSMELLTNGLLRAGASRNRLKAKVFGGGQMNERFSYIGNSNAEFAVSFLNDEGFEILAKDLGGTHARKVMFHSTSGKARASKSGWVEPQNAAPPAPKTAPPSSDITLF